MSYKQFSEAQDSIAENKSLDKVKAAPAVARPVVSPVPSPAKATPAAKS